MDILTGNGEPSQVCSLANVGQEWQDVAGPDNHYTCGADGKWHQTAKVINGGTAAADAAHALANLGIAGSGSPTTTFYVDAAFTGASNGSIGAPFKTYGDASAAGTALNAPYAVWMATGNYTESNALSLGTQPHVIFGNGSTLTFMNGLTLNGPAVVYDLNTVGNVNYAYSGTARSERHGGSYATGNITISGFVHWYGVQLTNTAGNYSVTVNGTLAGDFITGGMQIKSGGTSALIAMNNINLQNASGYNFDMTAGGVLAIRGGYLTTVGTFNIYVPTANSVATSHAIEDIIFVAGNGVSANGAAVYVGWANLSIPPSTALCPAFYALFNPWAVIVQPWVAQTANTASVTSGTVFTAPIAALYRITASVRTTTAGSAGTVSVTVDGETSGTADLTALNSTRTVSSIAYLAAAGTFALATTVASNTGAQYRIDYAVERIGQ